MVMKLLVQMLAVVMLRALSSAQWTATPLGPAELTESAMLGVSATGQAGTGILAGAAMPVFWNGTAESYVNLLPAGGWWAGRSFATDGQSQVGFVSGQNAVHASLWRGSPESFVDLHPGNAYSYSRAYNISNGQIVGWGGSASVSLDHALLWPTELAQVVDLHPSAARWSQALSGDGVRQGGWGQFGLQYHALLWHGSAASFIDMHPAYPEGVTESRIVAMAGGAQVGNARSGGTHFAIVWRGTPESAVDLFPTEAYYSEAYGTTGQYHLGRVIYLNGPQRIVLWTADERDSLYDLHSALLAAAGPGWSGVGAYCIAERNGKLYVGGTGVRTDGRQEAMLWIGRLPLSAPPRRHPRSRPPDEPPLTPTIVPNP